MERTTYTVAAYFAEDWFDRFRETDTIPDPEAVNVRGKGRMVLMDLTPDEVADLLDDARHYADDDGSYWDESVRPLCRSAARVVAALIKQGVK